MAETTQPSVAPIKPPAYNPVAAQSAADQSTQVTQSVVNVSQFGFTSNDLTSVKDIISYVRASQTAAKSADENAKYVQGQVGRVEQIAGEVETAKGQADNMYANIQVLGEEIKQGQIDVGQKVTEASAFSTTAQTAAGQAVQANNEVKQNALASVYRFSDQGVASSPFIIRASNGSVQHVTLNLATTVMELQEFPTDTDGTARQITVIFKQGTGANRVNWPQGKPSGAVAGDNRPIIMWNGGREPVFSYVEGMEDVVTLLTTDKGKHWYGFYNGGWFNTNPIIVTP